MKKQSSSLWLFVVAGLVGVGIIAFAVMQGRTPSSYDTFAQCLTEKGTKMYGAWWCPHCTNQKKLFLGAFDKVDSVECSPNGAKTFTSQECKDAGITSTPTWTFSDGTRVTGEMSLEDLSAKTSCPLPVAE